MPLLPQLEDELARAEARIVARSDPLRLRVLASFSVPFATRARAVGSGRWARGFGRSLVLVFSLSVTGLVVAVFLLTGVGHETHGRLTAGGHHLSGLPSVRPHRVPRTCGFIKAADGRDVLPPLVRRSDAPDPSLLSAVAALRRGSDAGEGTVVHLLDRYPDYVLTIFVRYIRVIEGPGGARIAIVPSTICSAPERKKPYIWTFAPPHQVLLMEVLSNPRASGIDGPVFIGTAKDINAGTANAYLDNAVPQGRSGIQLSVVPNGVARVAFSYPDHRPVAEAIVHNNVAIADPVPQLVPTAITWYDNHGMVIRTFRDPADN